MTTEQRALLELIRVGATENCLFGEAVLDAKMPDVYELACKQGVASVAWRGIEILYQHGVDCCEQELKLLWYARCQQVAAAAKNHEQKAAAFAEAVAPLQLAVLKGIDYAQYWSKAEWRDFGDLDVVVVESGELLSASHSDRWLRVENSKLLDQKCRKLGYDVDDHDYKHTEIRCNGMMVENHHFFTCFGGSKGATKQEEVLQELFQVSGFRGEICKTKLMSPNVNFTAYFLLAHAQNHFFYEGMSLRQILDWHFFLQKEGGNVDWSKVKPVLEKTGLKTFAVLLTQICNKYFDLRCRIFDTDSSLDDELVEKFLCDIFSDGYNRERKLLPMIGRLAHRFVRTVKFRELNKMSVATSVWRWLAFTSYLNRRPELY